MDFKQELSKNALPLLIIFALASLKFIVVPLVQWQDTELSETQQLQSRLSKSQRVLENQTLNTDLHDRLTPELARFADIVYRYDLESNFQLARQQEFDSLAAEHKVTLNSVAWENVKPLKELNLIRHSVEVRVEANGFDVLKFIAVLNEKPKLTITEFNLDIAGQGDSLGLYRGTLKLALYQEANDGY
ncbi:hypothetical protein ACFFK7_07900 [Pseudoalteromonas xiamenensis]|uniref:hypothetical protein n=1 Tax=Pseudoalteromonas xiamenensis TaxID=882626 RepID=UPI0035EE9968